jgi:hypothetical protein
MSDDEFEDSDYGSPISPLSSSTHQLKSRSSTPRDQRSYDRLYSVALSHKQQPVSERSSLLGSRDGSRSYQSTPMVEIPDPMEGPSSQPLQMLGRRLSRVFQSKTHDYDSNKDLLAAVGSGERVWYALLSSELI